MAVSKISATLVLAFCYLMVPSSLAQTQPQTARRITQEISPQASLPIGSQIPKQTGGQNLPQDPKGIPPQASVPIGSQIPQQTGPQKPPQDPQAIPPQAGLPIGSQIAPKTEPTMAPDALALSRKSWVDAHNAIRAAEGVGPMSWNETLANYARSYSTKIGPTCRFEKSMNGPYGENMFMGDSHATPKFVVDGWADEKKNYDPATKQCKGECGNYLQVMNPNSPQVGCTRVKCQNRPNAWIYMCNYILAPHS